MISGKIKNNCFWLCLWFLTCFTLSAQDLSEFSHTEITAGNSLQHVTSNLANSSTTDVDPYAYIKLEIKENEAPYTAYKFSATLDVTPILPNGSNGTPLTITLQVENNRTIAIGNITDLHQYVLDGNYGASVVVSSTTFEDVENGTAPVLNGAAPANIQLTIGYHTIRYYELPTTIPNLTASLVDNQLKLSWNQIVQARYYDVEWTWVDNYDVDATPKPQNQVYFSEKRFKTNSTRVQTDNTNYSIPLTFGKGYLLYRIRTVGNFLGNLNKNKYGPWTSGTNTKTFVSDWPDVYEITVDHEADMNWQFQASYAEEGKKKEIISYFDGSFRNRQTVTTINTDNTAVVGEVIYDAQGRPAVEVLPAPTLDNELKYHTDFRSKNSSGTPYSFTDFDLDTQNEVDVLSTDKLISTTSGASNYYSSDNVIINMYKDRIPSANGYPFSQIEYTPDNTGRIRRKSGVGINHQLGSTHEMEYYYGVPEQKELNRLFGYSVGHASKYKKNMVLDPNNQLTISYLDPQGRIIATALAGYAPENLIGLDDEDDNGTDADGNLMHGQVRTDLLGKITTNAVDTAIDNNQIGASGNYGVLQDELLYSAIKTVVFDEVRTFDYKVTNTNPIFTYGNDNCDTPYPIVYDLTIDILDEETQSIISSPVNETINLGDEPSNIFVLDQRTASVNRGTFSISKELRVNQEKLEEYADDYIARLQDENDPCYQPLDGIAPPPILIDGCFTSCADCEASFLAEYPTAAAYVTEQLNTYDPDALNALTTEEYNQLEDSLADQWAEAIAVCNAPCADGSSAAGEGTSVSCQIAKDQLLQDMNPNGQYGQTGVLSIYNTDNVLLSTMVSSTEYNSWKNPRHPDYDPAPGSGLYTAGHYYTDEGTISKIKVTLVDVDAEIYEPAIDVDAIPTLVPTDDVATSSQYWVEPQYLSDVADFLDTSIWENSWVNSLLVYHPEYDYLLYTEAFCGLQSSHPLASEGYFNSDGFDTFMQSITTYDQAVASNLLTNNALEIYYQDPYFSNTPGGSFENASLYNARKSIMTTALNSDYDGSGAPLMATPYATIVCNSITECPLVTNITTILNDISTKSTSEKDQFWNTYKANYLGLKQRIRSLFRNVHAQYQGSYNGCIGVSDAPLPLETTMSAYPTSAFIVSSYLSSSSDVLCDYEHVGNYINKQKRFIPSDMYYNSGADPSDTVDDIAEVVDYNYYINTGICPLARDLEVYLDGFFKETNALNISPTITRTYVGQYLTPNLYEEFGGSFPTTVNALSQLGSVSGQTLSLELNNSGILANSEVTVELPSGFSWTNYGSWTINSISTIIATYNSVADNFNYTVLAKVETSGGDLQEIIITGATEARISECSVTDPNTVGEYLGNGNTWDETGPCNKETYVSKAMMDVLNELVSTGQINSSSVDITNLESYADSYLVDFFGVGSPVLWKYTGANTYTIEVAGEQKFIMQLDQQIPLNVTITDVGFELLFSNSNTLIGQEIKITWQNLSFVIDSAVGSVAENATRILNFLCCGDINDYYNASSCDNISCDEVIMQVLNYVNANNILTQPFYTLSNDAGFWAMCVDEFYGLTPSDVVVWQSDSYSYQLIINGEVIFLLRSDPPLSSLDISSFVSLDIQQPYLPANVLYYGILTYLDSTNTLQTTSIFRSQVNCDSQGGSSCTGGDCYIQTQTSAGGGWTIQTRRNTTNCIIDESVGTIYQQELELSDEVSLSIYKDGANNISGERVLAYDLQEHFDQIENLIITESFFDEIMTAGGDYNTVEPGVVNDDELYLEYNGVKINTFPFVINKDDFILRANQSYVVPNLKIRYNNLDLCSYSGFALSAILRFKFEFELMDGHKINWDYRPYRDRELQYGDRVQFFVTNASRSEEFVFADVPTDNEIRFLDIYSKRLVNFTKQEAFAIIDDCEVEEPCIPQPLTPVSCTEKYPRFLEILTELGDNEQVIDETEFCNLQFAYIVDDYAYYLDTLGVLSATDPTLSLQYLTIADFGATPFNYGYNDMETVIDAYQVHVTSAATQDDVQTWSSFTTDYLNLISNNGEVCISIPAPLVIPVDYIITPPDTSPCMEFAESIYNSYSQDSYDIFLANEREDFIKNYIKNATENAIENFDMLYFDKEYQYTLYYYDQSGNLTQTVPPEGVRRFAESELVDASSGTSLNDQINAYRNANTVVENPALLPNHEYLSQYKYNTQNQLVWQYNPDAGETRYAYDKLGRIIASQNAKQLQNNTFSYTNYDSLGRIVSIGEFIPTVTLSINTSTGKLTSTSLTEDEIFNNYPESVSNIQREVTKTQYTEPVSYAATVFQTVDDLNPYIRERSRNRVTAIYYYDTYTSTTDVRDYHNATYYNYDIHGNVIEVAQHNKLLAQSLDVSFSGVKSIRYEYDLISGNVHKVYYQKGKQDQFIHRYSYDADSRIISVETSSDGKIWENDANYDYYNHESLARILIGDKEVQGIDYVYTIQGWIKGVNSNILNPTIDAGNDGTSDNFVAKDAFGYGLHYYNNDYESVGGINAFEINSSIQNPKNLYNGNVKQMTTALMNLNGDNLDSQLNHYEYDQLSRIKQMQGYALSNPSTIIGNYNSSYSYDNNGNILSLNRETVSTTIGSPQAMDVLGYTYKTKMNPITGLIEKTNQLDHVTDDVVDTNFEDIGNQSIGNYTYDAIGQLTADVAEGITNIDWHGNGRIARIVKQDGTEVKYYYDGLGNRVGKTVLPEDITTLYVRDASGNIIAVYKTNESDINNISTNKQLILKEHHIYGSTRLGLEDKNQLIPEGDITSNNIEFTRTVGDKRYELNNHLGNVLSVISDRKIADYESTINDYIFSPEVVTFNDYYPFGMLLPNRFGSSTSYRYAYGGHEKDDEISGEGKKYDFGGYGLDVRLGRRWQIDPVEQIGISPYAVFNNNPNFYIDPNGESPISMFAKAVAKAGLKKAAKEFVEAQIKKRLKVYMGKQGARKWATQLADDAMTFIDHATKTAWWEWVIEAIPIAGDAYGAAQLGKQGYTVWKGMEKFEKIAELGDRAAKTAWKKLGSNSSLTGKGAETLKGWIKNVNKNYGNKLNDNTIAGAIKEKFGLHSGFKPNGTPYKHLNSLQDRMNGLKNQIGDLQKQINSGAFEGDTLKAAQGVLDAAQKQYDDITHTIKSAEKAVEKLGKVYD